QLARSNAHNRARRVSLVQLPTRAGNARAGWLARSTRGTSTAQLRKPGRSNQESRRPGLRTVRAAFGVERNQPKCHSTQLTAALALLHSTAPVVKSLRRDAQRCSGANVGSVP